MPVSHARVGLAWGQRGGAPLQQVQLPGRELRAGLRARAHPSRPACSGSGPLFPQAGLATVPPHTHDLSVTNEITAVAAARLAPASCASPYGTAHQMAADEEGACTAKAFERLRQARLRRQLRQQLR